MALAWQRGDTVGRYVLDAQIGAGAMGRIYRARDPRLDREVAIKVLPDEMVGDAERRARFEREARAAGALSHPNVLAVHDVGEHDGSPYLVCELLTGRTLAERLATGPLPRAEAIEVARQVSRGLAAVHAQGIVHRDLKPSNLFLCDGGAVKILDFGVAHRRGADRTLTGTGGAIGTPRYMAPEQVRGREVDPRADLFALGTILYEMVSGARPFTGDSDLEIAAAILEAPPPPLHDPLLGPIVARCLAKEASDRFASAAELERALAGEGVARRPVRRAAPALVAVAVTAGVAAVAVAWRSHDDTRVPATAAPTSGAAGEEMPPPRERRITALPAFHWVITMAAAPDGSFVAYATHAGVWIQRLAGGPSRLVPPPTGARHMTVWGVFPDGRRLLVKVFRDVDRGETAEVGVLDLADGAFEIVRSGAEPWLLSPDGRLVPVTDFPQGQHPVRLLDLADRRERAIPAFGDRPRRFYAHAWSPDARALALVQGWPDPMKTEEVSLVIAPIDGEAEVIPDPGPLKQPGHTLAIAWPRPDRILYGRAAPDGAGGELWEVGLSRGRWDGRPPRRLHAWSDATIDHLQVAGDRLLFVKNRSQTDVHVVRLAHAAGLAGAPARLTQHDGDDVLGGWTTDGRILFESDRNGSWDVLAQDPAGGEPTLVAGGPDDEREPVAAGGAVLYWNLPRAGGGCRLMRLEPGRTPTPLLHRPSCGRAVGGSTVRCSPRRDDVCALIDPDGSKRALSSLDPSTGAIRALGRLPTYRAADLDRDGRRLLLVSGDETPTVVAVDLISGRARSIEVRVGRAPAARETGELWPVTAIRVNQVTLLAVRPDGSARALGIMPAMIDSPHLSPDGRWLAASVEELEANVWALEGLPALERAPQRKSAGSMP